MTSRVHNQTRRLQLWVKTSVVSVVSSEARFDGDDQATNSDDRRFCRNVDEALATLHPANYEYASHQVPHQHQHQNQHEHQQYQEEYDWILDGDPEHEEECRKSLQLLKQLNCGDESALEDREEDDDDDDDFGDFQSASPQCPDEKSLPNPEENSISMDQACADKGEYTDTHQLPQIPEQASDKVILDCYAIPLADIASPEGKFFRRRISESLSEDSRRGHFVSSCLQNIPKHFFEDVDDSLDVLRSIPWNHVPIWRSMDDVDMLVVEDHITQQLSLLDAFQSQLTKELLDGMCDLQSKLQQGNQLVHDMDMNLRLAKSYASQSQKSMEAAKGREEDFSGLVGAQSLLIMWQQKDVYSDLDSVLRKCADLFDKEQQTMQQIDSFGVDNTNFHQILESAEELRRVTSKQTEGGLSQLQCLLPLQKRAGAILGTFRERIEIALQYHVSQTCDAWDNFSGDHYRMLLTATLEVHKHQQGQIAEMKEGTCDSISVPPTVSNAWSSCILDVLAFEASKCFSRALLDPAGDATDSEYDTDLMNISFELKRCCGDYAMLKTIAHNLVTLRFDFEADKNYLSLVYHRLISLLTDVLHCHVLITDWHNEFQFGKTFRTLLRDMKVPLWECCEQVLVCCLDSYQSFASKKVLFPKTDSFDDKWLADLEGLHDVLQLTNQFLSLGNEFLDADQIIEASVTSLSAQSEKSELYLKLCDVSRKHLRSVHVEAMNSMGMMLSKESWEMVPLSEICEGMNVQNLIKTELTSVMRVFGSKPYKRRRWMNTFYERGLLSGCILKSMKKSGNPFHFDVAEGEAKERSRVSCIAPDKFLVTLEPRNGTEDSAHNSVYHMMECMLEVSGPNRLATECGARELVKWTCKLLILLKQLPMVADDVANVFRNLCDLYFVTVFRLCVGKASFERLAIGIDSVHPYIAPRKEETVATHSRKGSGGSFMESLGLRSSKTTRKASFPPIISPNVEAEICSPRGSDASSIEILKVFIERAQGSLSDIVNLDRIEKWMTDPVQKSHDPADGEELIFKIARVLEKRQGAAWSCLFVAALLNVAGKYVESTLTQTYLERLLGLNQEDEKKEDESEPPKPLRGVQSLSFYAESVMHAIPNLVDAASRVAATRAIMGRRVVTDVSLLGSTWEAPILSEYTNDYVDDLCDRCAMLWQFMSTSGKLPLGVRISTWEQVVEAGFLAMLEGFARVPYCSTEGRSLMSMDLGAFASGVSPRSIVERLDDDDIGKPPSVMPTRGRQYVDTYVKAFYLPDEDVMKWIASNHQEYHLNHCLSLVAEGNGRPSNSNQVTLIQGVKKLYA
jgi:hypothetical protein